VSRRDHLTYTREQIETLLPSVWDDEFLILASKAERVGSSGQDPAHGNNLAVMVIDVARAYRSLQKWQHELLYARYHHALGLEAIVALWGAENEQEVADDLDGALSEMIEFLGGSA
jgi:hypothetical protein